MDHLHEEEGKVKSYSIQNVMMVTCMQKRVNIKLNPERQDGHLHAEEVEWHGGHLQAEEGEYKVQLITEHIVITCMQMKVKGKARDPHSIKSLSSTDSLVGFNEVGFAKHIHVNRRG